RVDAPPPHVDGLEPRTDSASSSSTPQLWGTGGLATGDDSTVTVKLWSGSSARGSPAETTTAPPDTPRPWTEGGAPVDTGGAWRVPAPVLADGTYTVRAEQPDDARNLGLSRANTFAVDS